MPALGLCSYFLAALKPVGSLSLDGRPWKLSGRYNLVVLGAGEAVMLGSLFEILLNKLFRTQ